MAGSTGKSGSKEKKGGASRGGIKKDRNELIQLRGKEERGGLTTSSPKTNWKNLKGKGRQ